MRNELIETVKHLRERIILQQLQIVEMEKKRSAAIEEIEFFQVKHPANLRCELLNNIKNTLT
jgi:hypothetical protein